MWTADIIPGVSWGTIAFITGIYDRLIWAIHRLDKRAVHLLVTGQLTTLRTYVNGTFLLILFVGIGIAIVSLTKLVSLLLISFTTYVYSFFFGLILASVRAVAKIEKISFIKQLLPISIGVILGRLITHAEISQRPHTAPTIFVSGMIASMAMILPGISWSYILLILGKYEFILSQVNLVTDVLKHLSQEIVQASINLGTFFIWVVAGLLVFSRFLHFLLDHQRTITISLLLWCMLGTLPLLLPSNILFYPVTQLTSILICIIAGALVVLMITHVAHTQHTPHWDSVSKKKEPNS